MDASEDNQEETVEQVLKSLVRTVTKCFYQPKDLLIIDLIIKEKRVTEKMLEDILKFDLKLIRTSFAALRNDGLVYMSTEKEVDSDGKMHRVNYFYIKYGKLVNVVKYKLDNVRHRVETLERESNTKESFTCTGCDKKWTDLQAGELFHVKTLSFRCNLCGKPIKEDLTGVSNDIRQLVSLYNEQTSPIYDLLKKAEDLVSQQ